MRKQVLVLGGNFGGLTAALSIKYALEGGVDVTVVSASDRFLFYPSLMWRPFGKRRPVDITLPLAPAFESHDVAFEHSAATRPRRWLWGQLGSASFQGERSSPAG